VTPRHVAAWVGIGGEGLGPGGATEWIQAGLSADADGRIEPYYEVTPPRSDPRYVTLGDGRAPHTVAVVEMRKRPNWWRVWVDGRPPALRSTCRVATARSIRRRPRRAGDGGVGACNDFAYRFTRVGVSTSAGGGWQPLRHPQVVEDPGLSVLRRRGGFDARVLG
jgi:hypothetical protein